MISAFGKYRGRTLAIPHLEPRPRLEFFKAFIVPNATYSCEAWAYTKQKIARLERTYMHQLRNTLLMKHPTNPTPRQVLDQARHHHFSIFPLQCYIQRQQLKFLWRITHSSARSKPRIALNGRLYIAGHKCGGGGQRKSYRACIADALLVFGTTFDMCNTSSQSEWYKFVEGPGLLLASAHWESLRPAFQKIDRVYTKAGGNLNLTNRRRRIIPVNDDEADAWVDDFSYHDTTNPRPEPILPRRIRHTSRRATRVAKKRKATSQHRKDSHMPAPPPDLN